VTATEAGEAGDVTCVGIPDLAVADTTGCASGTQFLLDF